MKPKFIPAFMKMAETVAELSSARRLKVGSMIVKDGRVLSIGYNGTPAGWDNNCEHEELIKRIAPPDPPEDETFGEMLNRGFESHFETKLTTKDEVLHSESNAILKCARDGEATKDATMFVTHAPCINCAKLIHQAGISKVYYKHFYKYSEGIDFLEKCNIEVIQINVEETET